MAESKRKCPACRYDKLRHFYSVNGVPVNSCITLNNINDALTYPKGNIDLCMCINCNFIFNASFDCELVEYSERYQDQQIYSSTFNSFQEKIVDDLVNRYNLKNKTVMEIGCGKGDFLNLVCEKGNNKGIGVDPSAPDKITQGINHTNIRYHHEFYSEKHNKYCPDLICCRHTLEHIQEVDTFMKILSKTISSDKTRLFFEVPNAQLIIDNYLFHDIYYEHCSYFTPSSITHFFNKNGFQVDDIKIVYDDQYILLHASINKETNSTITYQKENIFSNNSEENINSFSVEVRKKIDYWRDIVLQSQSSGKNLVIWGAGSKCVSFLNALALNNDGIFVVDINPLKQNKYIPGIDMPVESPDIFGNRIIDNVIIMNKIYRNEVKEIIYAYSQKPSIYNL